MNPKNILLKGKSVMDPKSLRKITDTMYEEGTFKADIAAFIKARVSAFAIQTNEESRFINYIRHMAETEDMNLYNFYIWDIVEGLRELKTNKSLDVHARLENTDLYERIIVHICEKYTSIDMKEYEATGKKADVYLLLDFFVHTPTPTIKRRLKDLVHINSVMNVIMISDDAKFRLCNEMRTLIPCLKAPKAQAEEFMILLCDIVASYSHCLPDLLDHTKKNGEEILDMIKGKTIHEAQILLQTNIAKYEKFLKYH